MLLRSSQFTTAHYAAIVSTVAFLVSGGSLIYAKRSYDLNVARDQRELMDKQPSVDIQMRPAGVSTLSIEIAITNRADVEISPLDIVVDHSVEAGSLYLASAQQSIEKLSSSLSLKSMGLIQPKGRKVAKATLAGVTDGELEQFTPGLELGFTVRLRLADQQDTILPLRIVRRILPPLADRLDPTPEMFLAAIMDAEKARKTQQRAFFVGTSLLGAVALISLIVWLFRLRRTRASKVQS